jgi:uncharacterized protein with NAD-binding domain and iron-sulfur cluster
MPELKKKVIVIGAGLAGLAAAFDLAEKGLPVTVRGEKRCWRKTS